MPSADHRCLLTPDFYQYRWAPLSAAAVRDAFVVLDWADGMQLRAFHLWLRENAVGQGGIDEATREGLIDPADLRDDWKVSRVHVTAEGALAVVWAPDDLIVTYHPGWLRHVAEGLHSVASWLPKQIFWTTRELAEPPSYDGARALSDPSILTPWVNDLLRYGIAWLHNLPNAPDIALQIGQHIGVLRGSNFGLIWDVKADVETAGHDETNTTANTHLRLGPHTDLPTRELPPGFQFLHCLRNTVAGGFLTMADGAAITEHVRTTAPDHYDALTTLKWVFFNRGPTIDHRWSGPIIDRPFPNAPLTIRAFYPVRAFPDMPHDDVPRAYAAMKYFYRLAADELFQIRYPFAAGDLVGFDNRRILHGRDAFAASGQRHLRGVYMDYDEVKSYARVANRALGKMPE